ncbi:PTS N-acetylglucosamine transporter subunit IIBC [Lentzea tibetensis]|uniref:PTS N-acetylglucosamine transporter subunit IIBC n=1 Tax=Lentzea tibetensis TaxID=2591470 RepID=A0A563ET52_9PSEU|nr:PTS transporter subunit EIIC [Lentzea tibetensis]TWP50846.1 PTS N-acetylglucosamine transporter subunit IIBC [Lentzea tibetensis]
MSASAPQATGGREFKGLAALQRLGRSLMLPIAALPAAGLLLRLGQDDLLGRWKTTFGQDLAAVVGGAGGVLFDYLPLLFAVGVAVGFARKADGSTALAAVVGYLVFSRVVQVLNKKPNPLHEFNDKAPATLTPDQLGTMPMSWPYGVLAGIMVGVISALLWQKYYRIKLPPYLAFFGGRRFVPIITAGVMVLLGVVFALIFPIFDSGLTKFGNAIAGSTVVGAGVYGIANRLLIPFGLHHIINTFMWFVFGKTNDVTGDLNRFFAKDPTAGTFMTGFFPIFMFALPAAALAIWHTARPDQRKLVGGIMLAGALTSFITGVTEPLEFAFMFVAWPLYLIHAFLTGTALAITNALDIHMGFSFSAGAIDYILNFGIGQKAWMLIPIGLVYAAIYYFLFRFVITKWNLKTPGREDDESPETDESVSTSARNEK